MLSRRGSIADMKLKMHENSLFAVLLRAPWWVSLLVAAGTVVAARIVIPVEYALFSGIPFLVIGILAGWRQLRAPSSSRIEGAMEKLRGMNWDAFAAALEEGFKREGYAVRQIKGAADLELEKSGRASLVAAKRWKASRTGVEPLRDLHAAATAREAGAIYLCAGDITDTARSYAAEKKIHLIEGQELAKLAGAFG